LQPKTSSLPIPAVDLSAPSPRACTAHSPPPHSSWVHEFGFFFTDGAFRGFEKGAFTPLLVAALPDCLIAVLSATFFTVILGFFGDILLAAVDWSGEIGGGALGERDQCLGEEQGSGRQEEPRDGENERSGGRKVVG
jgi:hypothetical protein